MAPLDPGIAALIAAIDAAPYPPLPEGTVEGARKGLLAMTARAVTAATQVPVGEVSDTEVAGLPARIYRPTGDGPFPTLLYFHGGGFVIGDLDTHDQTCRRICAGADTVVVAVDYRLSPEVRFPAATEDAVAALRWTADHLPELGGTETLAVGGDSAGGNLSIVATQTLPDLAAAQVLIYPATDFFGEHASRTANASGYYLDTATMKWFGEHYFGTDAAPAPEDPRHSPLLASPEVLATQPPTLLVTAEYDPLLDEGEAYATRLREAGVDVELHRYEGMVHGFIDMGAASPAAAAAMDDFVARVRKLLHADPRR